MAWCREMWEARDEEDEEAEEDDDEDPGADCFSFRTRVLHTTHRRGRQRWVTATCRKKQTMNLVLKRGTQPQFFLSETCRKVRRFSLRNHMTSLMMTTEWPLLQNTSIWRAIQLDLLDIGATKATQLGSNGSPNQPKGEVMIIVVWMHRFSLLLRNVRESSLWKSPLVCCCQQCEL